jgi:selenide,water dikinase
VKRLLLVGGGHSHVEVVRRFGAAPPAGAETMLVSPWRHAPYSGMLPGLIAGHYDFHECHIDLEQLCRAARLTFRRAEVAALDPARGIARFADGGECAFDLLSLDVGSLPDALAVPGASRHAVAVKPVAGLLAAWDGILAAARAAPQRIAVVGGGAGGVELAAAMHHRLRAEGLADSRLAVVTDTPGILPGHPAAARRIFERLFAERGVRLHCGSPVVEVSAGALRLMSGARVGADRIIWATSATAPRWLAESGLEVDSHGFVRVGPTLRSTSHKGVFAAGDCASLLDRPLPKAGVYAVRQGPPLAENLRRALAGQPLVRYAPQRRALALIGTGDRRAVATWGPFALGGAWLWRWKDRIDRRFMARYRSAEPAPQRG